MSTSSDIPVPDLTGQLTLVTGASDGIGLHIAERLALAGAQVVLPVRNHAKGEAAARRIRETVPGAAIDLRELDLASLESVAALADDLVRAGRPVDVLVNNAGVMTPPTRQVSVDGYELQLATNHLGHVALTLRLLPILRGARVTTQVSMAANRGSVNWTDINWERRYDAMAAYSSSKIAVGLFGLELQRRSEERGWGVVSNLSHPGVSPTNLLAAQPGMGRHDDTRNVRIIRALSRRGILAGTPETAALPAVYAATSAEAAGGRFYGPGGFLHLRGAPTEQRLYSRLRDADDAQRVWELSERLTGLTADACAARRS